MPLPLVAENLPLVRIDGPQFAANIFRQVLEGSDCERFALLAISLKGAPVKCEVLHIGNDRSCPADIRSAFRWALLTGRSGACALVMAHNHPSGDFHPSPEDILRTKEFCLAGDIIGIPILDHLIMVDGGGFNSLRQMGFITNLKGEKVIGPYFGKKE